MIEVDLGGHEAAPSSPDTILAFVSDNIAGLTTIKDIARVEDSLHNRLRILRWREQPCAPIRAALMLCADRRREIAMGDACQALPGATKQQVSK